MDELIERLNEAWRKLYGDGDEHGVCDTLAEAAAALAAREDALAQENEAMRRCAIKYLEWLGVTHMPLEQALRDDMCNPRMCGDAALQDQENSDD